MKFLNVCNEFTAPVLLAAALYFTWKGRGFPVRCASLIFREFLSGLRGSDGKAQRRVTASALAAAMGTGNLTGVAAAIAVGGPGALFWMWVSGLLGMSLVYAENVLGIRYRKKNGTQWQGGPAVYLREGAGSPKLAVCFSAACVLVSLSMGNMTQVHSMAHGLTVLGVPRWLTGLGAACVAWILLGGGGRLLACAAERLLPAAALLYLSMCMIALLSLYREIPAALLSVLDGALGISAVSGGIFGAAVRRAVSVGLRRGIFSNEAGLGSSPLLHADAPVTSPEHQGLCGAAEVFLDTIVCCTATGLVLLTSGAAAGEAGASEMVLNAFSACFGKLGIWAVSTAMVLFALATLIGWGACGMKALQGLISGGEPYYRILFSVCALAGAVSDLTVVWALADLCNLLMMLPNLYALIRLRGEISFPVNKSAKTTHTCGQIETAVSAGINSAEGKEST